MCGWELALHPLVLVLLEWAQGARLRLPQLLIAGQEQMVKATRTISHTHNRGSIMPQLTWAGALASQGHFEIYLAGRNGGGGGFSFAVVGSLLQISNVCEGKSG